MANNRLYVGNRCTKEYFLLAKGYGGGWSLYGNDGVIECFREMFSEPEGWGESNVNGYTDLFFFTESDGLWDVIVTEESGWNNIRSEENQSP